MTPEFFAIPAALMAWVFWPCFFMCLYIMWECIKRTRWGFGRDIARSWGVRYYLVCLLATVLALCFLLRQFEWVYVLVTLLLFDYMHASSGVWKDAVPLLAHPPKRMRRIFTTTRTHHG